MSHKELDRKRVRTIVGFTALPMMFLIASVIMIPFIKIVEKNIFVSLVLTIVAEILTIFWALWTSGDLKNWKHILMLDKFKWRYPFIGAGIGVLFFILLQVVSVLLDSAGYKINDSNTSSSLASLKGFLGYFTLFILTPFVVPFVEEVLFRGIIFNFINNGLGAGKKYVSFIAILTSGVFFSAAHFQGFGTVTDYFILILIFSIGTVNAILDYFTKSLWTSYALHMVYNLVSSLGSVLAIIVLIK